MENDKYGTNTAAAGALAMLGGVAWGISPALSWAQLGALRVDGFQKLEVLAYAYIVVGVLAALAGMVTLAQKKDAGVVAAAMLTLIGGFFHYGILSDISKQLSNIRIGDPSLGGGAYMPLIGTGLLVFAALGVFLAGEKPEVTAPPVSATEGHQDPEDRLTALEKLKADGVITELELERRRMEILREI